MHRRRGANGVRSDIPCQQCRRSLGGLGHQKAIQVNEDFLGSDIVSTSGATCLKKCLKPKGQRTAEKTGCHGSSFLGPGHRHSRRVFRSARWSGASPSYLAVRWTFCLNRWKSAACKIGSTEIAGVPSKQALLGLEAKGDRDVGGK